MDAASHIRAEEDLAQILAGADNQAGNDRAGNTVKPADNQHRQRFIGNI